MGPHLPTIVAEIIAAMPVPKGWPAACVGAVPKASFVKRMRDAGWPIEHRTAMLPQAHHLNRQRAKDVGQRVADAPQPCVIVPEPWLRELAKRMGRPFEDVCRGLVDPE